jgi:hypothetical protein
VIPKKVMPQLDGEHSFWDRQCAHIFFSLGMSSTPIVKQLSKKTLARKTTGDNKTKRYDLGSTRFKTTTAQTKFLTDEAQVHWS